MTYRSYAVGWNDTQHGFEELMGRNKDPEDYCDRIIKAVRASIQGKRDMYRIGALNCISWYRKYKTLPPRLSWQDREEPWNNVEGAISAHEMRTEIEMLSIDETKSQLEGVFT